MQYPVRKVKGMAEISINAKEVSGLFSNTG